METQIVIIDEPIHIYDEQATRLWQKALWAKELGYRKEYKNSILPMGVDDFFATHLIVAEKMANGDLEPMVMYKSVRRSQCQRFNVPFGGEALLKGTPFENSFEMKKILNDESEISYDSSWSINPKYKTKENSALLRDYVTLFCCRHHLETGYSRWLTAGATKFKIDDYFEWLGGQPMLDAFSPPIADGDTVRMFYIPDTTDLPSGPLKVCDRLSSEWENRLEFRPTTETNKVKKVA